MPKYKIVASDLDGTLLNSNNALSAQNSQAITALARMGVQFVPSTGRTLSEILPDLRNHPDVRYISYSNGAVVQDMKTGEKLSFALTNEDVNYIVDVLENYPVHWAVRHDGVCYVDAEQMNAEAYAYHNLTLPHVDCVNNFGVPMTDYVNFIRTLSDVEVIALFFHSESDLKECEKIISASGKYHSAGTSPHNLEIFNARAGKDSALVALADKLGVPIAQTIAMGDSHNDMAIIKRAGLGLAVSNGFDEVKAVADEVVCSNDENSLEFVLNRYF